MNLVNKSKKAWKEGGVSLFLKRVIKYIYNKTIPRPIRGFLDILINERSIVYPSKGEWLVFDILKFQNKRKLPVLTENINNVRQATEEHQKIMEKIYTKENFVELEDGDVVVEVGAHIGGFTIAASDKAEKIVAIDPNSSISDSLNFNTKDKTNVEIVPKAAWNEKTQLKINQSLYPNDNSILTPDENDLDSFFIVEADTIPNICKDKEIKKIDFLKIEAEGVEPEILESALEGQISISKISIDGTAERNGEPTTRQVEELLREYNYEIKRSDKSERSGKIVYGRKRD